MPAGRQATVRRPAMASEVDTRAIRMPGFVPAKSAIAIATIAISKDGLRKLRTPLVHGAAVKMPPKRKIEKIETLQAERARGADEAKRKRAATDSRSARPLPDPRREKRAADAHEQAEIDPIRASQITTANGPALAGGAAMVTAPIENTIDPATGWPSSETTR